MHLSMRPLVSICIPAWERPVLVRETIQSCLDQTYRDIEVVITDDSRTDRVERATADLRADPRVRYMRNPRRLGQAGNVNRLFDVAKGDRVVLLHDDDVLLPGAIEAMDAKWRGLADPLVCYGKVVVIADDGEALETVTQTMNYEHYRDVRHAGVQADKLWSALVQQLPSNGYMMRTEVARATRFRGFDEVGDACDYDFTLRLAAHPGVFCCLAEYVSKYRLTNVSVTTTSNVIDRLFHVLEELDVPPHLERLKEHVLTRRVMHTARSYLRTGQVRRALRLMLRPRYLAMNLSAAGLTNLVFFLPPPAWRRLLVLSRSSGVERLRKLLRAFTLRARVGERL
jgi:glycosyltransferase involved in cell wall biosynthesis